RPWDFGSKVDETGADALGGQSSANSYPIFLIGLNLCHFHVKRLFSCRRILKSGLASCDDNTQEQEQRHQGAGQEGAGGDGQHGGSDGIAQEGSQEGTRPGAGALQRQGLEEYLAEPAVSAGGAGPG